MCCRLTLSEKFNDLPFLVNFFVGQNTPTSELCFSNLKYAEHNENDFLSRSNKPILCRKQIRIFDSSPRSSYKNERSFWRLHICLLVFCICIFNLYRNSSISRISRNLVRFLERQKACLTADNFINISLNLFKNNSPVIMQCFILIRQTHNRPFNFYTQWGV